MAGECNDGLNKKCFDAHPKWARQAFAYRLLHTIVPKQLSKNLPRAFKIPLIFRDIIISPDVTLPPGSLVGPGSEIFSGWQPGDPLPPGVYWSPVLPPGVDAYIEAGGDNFGFFIYGPPGPPGATSKSGYPSISPGVDLTEFEMTGCGTSGYTDPLTNCFDATDDDLETRARWEKTAAPGTAVSKIQFNFIGNDQVVNGLRVYNLHNDAGSTWTFGAYMPGFTPLLTGIENVPGWSDVYTFDNEVALNQTELRADDALDTLNQESYIYEIELNAY